MTDSSAKAISIGAIVVFQNSVDKVGYLDSCGWVAQKPEFWNVAGTERIFVSTYKDVDRGGGTTSWQLVSANAQKKDGEPLVVGDHIHLRNMYPNAGFLDCCGWVEHLGPFNTDSYVGKVSCAVFTAGVSDRDNGTGIWIVEADAKPDGTPIQEGDSIRLRNAYPANGKGDSTGALVAYGELSKNSAFADFLDRNLLVFTSTNHAITQANGQWRIKRSPAFPQSTRLSFDFFRPELLKGRSHAMQSLSSMTNLVLLDALQALSGSPLRDAEQATAQDGDRVQLFETLLQASAEKRARDLIDYDFQLKQLWNLWSLSKTLKRFDQETVQVLMQQLLTTSQNRQQLAPLDLIRSVFQSIANDHEIIQRASMQRRASKSGDSYYQSSQALELLVMDKLAIRAIAPFQHLLPKSPEQLAVLTYFSDRTHIHHLPYSRQYILIGVNYDRISPEDMTSDAETLTEKSFASFELMAIPHEVGHYIYRNGLMKNGKSFEQLSEEFKSKPYYNWCEELFADLYGCLIAGPLSVFSMQAFLTSGDKKRIWKDDDEHPTPILRPFILSEMLRVLGKLDPAYELTSVADQLDSSWVDTLHQWGYERVDSGTGRPQRIYMPDDASTQLERVINVNRVLESIRPIIADFAKALMDARARPNADTLTASQHERTKIPWRSKQYSNSRQSTADYAREMALLTEMTAAAEAVPVAVLHSTTPDIGSITINDATKAEQQLEAILDIWGDSGPHGWGGH